MIGASLLSVGCDNEMKGKYGSPSSEELTACANDAVTTGPCKIESAGVAVTDDIADLIAANIVDGVTIFGVLGVAAGPYAACTDDALNAGQCSTPANRYVTAASGADVTGWANGGATTTVTGTIANAYYSGKSCQFTDADLLATNIRLGTNVFGVGGSLIEAYAGCTDDALNAGQCSTAANRYVTATNGADVNGVAGSLTAAIPTGFYSGKMCTMSDADLIATNIRNTVNVFGVVGSLVEAHAACSDNALNAGQCSTAVNRYVTATNGSDVNGVDGSLTASIPTGFYIGRTCTTSDTDLAAGNIRNGVTIFGVLGNYVGTGTFMTSMASTMFRNSTEPQMTLYDESVTDAGTPYPNEATGYRAVPQIGKDDDGYQGGSVTYVNRSGWGANTCGTAQATIDLRIANCAAHGTIGPQATWDGTTKGNAGQGVWKLVSRTANKSGIKGREVWRDERTGLLWSSLVSNNTMNWCRASGSNNITNNPTAEDDTEDICDNATYQNTGTGPATKAISACFEDGGNFFTTTHASIDNLGKAGLSLSSTPVVAWRLPNIYDYHQAEVNGIRFVMPDMGSNGGDWEWSASVLSWDRGYAWNFDSIDGLVDYDLRGIGTRVRCVGR